MKNRLEEIKNEVVKEFGYKDFITYEKLMIDSYDFDNTIIIEKIAKLYAKECSQSSLEKASENAECEYDYFVDKKSITNPENIILL